MIRREFTESANQLRVYIDDIRPDFDAGVWIVKGVCPNERDQDPMWVRSMLTPAEIQRNARGRMEQWESLFRIYTTAFVVPDRRVRPRDLIDSVLDIREITFAHDDWPALWEEYRKNVLRGAEILVLWSERPRDLDKIRGRFVGARMLVRKQIGSEGG